MNKVVLDLEQAEEFVSSTPGAFWDGWVMYVHRPDRRGFKSGQFRADGLRRVGRWGIATRIPMSDNGTWEVPGRVMARGTRN